MNCSYCGSNKHTLKNCPNTWGGSINRQNMRCTYCGERNHTAKACPKTWGGSAKRAWHPDDVADDFVLDKDP